MAERKFELPSEAVNFLDGRLSKAIDLALEGGRSTLELFCDSRVEVERKGDDSPVTIADRGAEKLIRAGISEHYANDAILGEEFGDESGSTDVQWIIDPIDGTKSFISGVPLYSTLIAIVAEGRCQAGVIYIPALDEIIFAGTGIGAWHSRRGSALKAAQVSKRMLEDGLFVCSQVDAFAAREAEANYAEFEKSAYMTRTWGDGYGYLLVATGRAELMIDPNAKSWDIAAAQPIIDEAGGKFSSWSGVPSPFEGDGVATNGLIHQSVLESLKSAPKVSEAGTL
jgi:histidinol phosphatase-like enzyme (inositol monophosphatase family)